MMREEQYKENEYENIDQEESLLAKDESRVAESRESLVTEGDHILAVSEKVPAPTYRYAGFWMRLWAFLLDLLIVWSIGAIVVFPLFRLLGISESKTFLFSPASIATAIILYGYFILMTKYFKQTLGKMVFGLKVIDLKHDHLSWKSILFREGVGRYIALFYFPLTYIVFLVAAFTSKKQGVHDFIADTTVIHEN
ncbi:RDD family protein [Sutcliffiella horikoshii]|uniref:RDD family protein n=1 Tax=Sutcliffiella horikoshii TaxID=79883 RepID=UPI001F24D828|nr:RDD family protein [Sutcliffiella horikoshii]